MGDAEPRRVKVLSSLADIEPAAWDACANPEAASFDPFLSHAFLAALERSGAVGQGTGWIPHHLALEDGRGGIDGVMPLYVKFHSQGEYVFDHGWGEALERVGGDYYPKLQAAVPFTPVPGRRLLVKPGSGSEEKSLALAAAGIELARRLSCSSVHVTFLTEAEWTRLGAAGFLQRMGVQYHWTNAGYRSFDDFLATLSSRNRKTIRRERRDALAGGLEIEHLTGAAITDAHWSAMYGFYMDTGSRKWGRPYLNRRFFTLLGQSLSDRCLLVMVKRAGRYIAGALNLVGGDCLYGRYWGAIEQHPFLHFEVCYYAAIDYAIAHGLARVEAGAQGEHKLIRGYRPVATYSAHWLADRRLEAAVAQFLDGERREMADVIAALGEHGPYKKCPDEQD